MNRAFSIIKAILQYIALSVSGLFITSLLGAICSALIMVTIIIPGFVIISYSHIVVWIFLFIIFVLLIQNSIYKHDIKDLKEHSIILRHMLKDRSAE